MSGESLEFLGFVIPLLTQPAYPTASLPGADRLSFVRPEYTVLDDEWFFILACLSVMIRRRICKIADEAPVSDLFHGVS